MSGDSPGSGLSRRRLLTRVAPLSVAGGALAAGGVSLGIGRAAAETGTFTTRRLTLYAEKVGDGFGYGLAPGAATVPGPTLVMREGERLEVKLVNRTAKTLSMHAHGVDYDVHSDGTMVNDGCVAPGASRKFVFTAHRPSRRADGTYRAGSAGYWHYHDHCMGTEHGTEGISKGLYGALIVRREGDPLPGRPPYVVVMLDSTINGRLAPKTPTFVANSGQRVEWVVISHMNSHHTFHLHGHRWADNRTGYLTGPADSSRVIDIKTIGPGESFGFQVIAGEGVGPGVWMYHCHVQFHADGGMVGTFLVRTPSGGLPTGAQAALDHAARFRPAPMRHDMGMHM